MSGKVEKHLQQSLQADIVTAETSAITKIAIRSTEALSFNPGFTSSLAFYGISGGTPEVTSNTPVKPWASVPPIAHR